MSNHRPVHFFNIVSMPAVPFDINVLESEALRRLFQETASFRKGLRIEMIHLGEDSSGQKEHPAATIGMNVQTPTVLFVESLDREQRVEAISHELGHLLLAYRFRLGLVGLRIPYRENSEETYRYLLDINKSWSYLLGQIPNTIHHLILIDYLKERYGIMSSRHLHFLQRQFGVIVNENSEDREFQHARGLVAFEYEKLLGKVDEVVNPRGQSEFFRKAYLLAEKYFGNYGSSSIPTPSLYTEGVLSFLEGLGYRKEDFIFFPGELSEDREKDGVNVSCELSRANSMRYVCE